MEQQIDKKLYGHHAKNLMKTDIREKEDCYEMQLDLPGFKTEDNLKRLRNSAISACAWAA